MKGKVLQFGKIDDGQYEVQAALLALFRNTTDLNKFKNAFEKIEDSEFHSICKLTGNTLIYKSETIIPEKYDTKKKRVLIVVGNPATHSIKNGMFYYSQGKKKTKHKFWGKLEKAELLPKIPKTTRKDEAAKRKEIIKGGDGHKDYVIGLTTFYSLPTPVGIDARGVERLFKPSINIIQEEEYERIKGYSFSKGATLVFTQESSHEFVKERIEEGKHPFKAIELWPIRVGSGEGLIKLLS